MGRLIKKEELNRLISRLLGGYDVFAPVEKEGVVFFGKISSPDEIVFDRHTDYSPKHLFLPSPEEIFCFSGKKMAERTARQKRKVVFGIRKCDIDALAVLDKVFLDEPKDELYKQKRGSTLLIGLACSSPFKNCFCSASSPKGKFDVMLMPAEDSYYAEAGSEAGERLIKEFEKMEIEIKYAKCPAALKEGDNAPAFNHPVWQENAEKCLGCGACTAVCPTCGCFEVYDELNLDLCSGSRKRAESSCLLPDFTRAAGDIVFRKERVARYRHRMYHKLVYFKERYGISMCVGCGRCKSACPVDICDIPKLIRVAR